MLENVISQRQIFAKHSTYLESIVSKRRICLCYESVPITFIFEVVPLFSMLTRIQEIIASSSPLRQCFGVPHALASDANIPWRADDLSESACARTSRRFMIDGCTLPLCEYVTLPCGRPEMELGMNAISTEFAPASHIERLRNARVTFVHSHSLDFPEIDYPSFRSGNSDREAFTIVNRLRCRIHYEFRDAYVYFIVYLSNKRFLRFFSRKEPRCTCEL